MENIARLCQRARFVVVGVWLLAVVALSALSGALGGEVSDDYDLPGSESQRAVEILEAAGLAPQAGTQAQFVLSSRAGLESAEVQAEVDELTAEIERLVPQARVVSPLTVDGSHQLAPDGTVAYIAVDLPSTTSEELADLQESFGEARDSYDSRLLTVEVGGLAVDQDAESGPPSEVIGILAAIVILLLAFGSVFAMGLPILVGVIGAASGVATVGLAARWVDMPSFAAPVAAMIAIGVGIDYALLVVTRYREVLRSGAAPADAVVVAQSTAGRSVVFAGLVVVIASLGLVLMSLKLITGVALGIAASVLITMLAAITLLPALLSITGRRIDKFAVRRRSLAQDDGGPARRWSHQIQRRPLPWALAAGTLLIVMSIPALDMRLGFSDAGTKQTSDTSRRAYDLLAAGFGPGTNGPLVVAVKDEEDVEAAVSGLACEVEGAEGVASVSPPFTSANGEVAVMQVVPTTGPRDEATADLVHRLREDVIATTAAVEDSEVAVGGSTAAAVDFADYTSDRLPLFLTVVLVLAMLLLLAVFRGVAVALKAVVVNLLSIGAAFGATVAVFQWGWGVDLLDLGASGPFEAWAPMMLIAIVFGLSMDYEVFLLSRIKEEYTASRDNAAAVAEGLARTARVITAAAAIMVCVFGSFVLGDSRELQLFGFGLAVAVLVDATIVRMVLVPSLMELLGDRNWWLPGWLDRLLPRLSVEGPVDRQAEEVRV